RVISGIQQLKSSAQVCQTDAPCFSSSVVFNRIMTFEIQFVALLSNSNANKIMPPIIAGNKLECIFNQWKEQHGCNLCLPVFNFNSKINIQICIASYLLQRHIVFNVLHFPAQLNEICVSFVDAVPN